jgi:Flp pilus assembly protein TadG
MMRFRLPRRLHGLLDDVKGVAAVEFALILPIVLMLFLGGMELSNAAATHRKLTDTTIELANVVSQYTTMAPPDVSSVFNASAQIMAPYPTSQLSIVLSEVTTNSSNVPRVTWSQAYNGATPLAVGATVTMPSGLPQPSTSYMLVQTTYAYSPTFGSGYVSAIPMSDSIYILPRQSATITYTG